MPLRACWAWPTPFGSVFCWLATRAGVKVGGNIICNYNSYVWERGNFVIFWFSNFKCEYINTYNSYGLETRYDCSTYDYSATLTMSSKPHGKHTYYPWSKIDRFIPLVLRPPLLTGGDLQLALTVGFVKYVEGLMYPKPRMKSEALTALKWL